MKIYMAARYSRRLEILAYATALAAEGHEITSRWLNGTHEARDGDTRRWGEFAQDDIDDIGQSDTVIAFTERDGPGRNRGGRHVEFGVGLITGRKMIVIGPVENVFHALPGVLQFDTWGAFMAVLLDGGSSVPLVSTGQGTSETTIEGTDL
jgi:hypothetical protein